MRIHTEPAGGRCSYLQLYSFTINNIVNIKMYKNFMNLKIYKSILEISLNVSLEFKLYIES